MKVDFIPKITTVGFYKPDLVFDFKQLRDETMFFSCSPEFVMAHKDNAPITCDIIKAFGFEKTNTVVDTRVNMLMPGQYPSIPGWHCDDVPRREKYSQPDFSLCSDAVKHYMVLISDTKNPGECVSGTEFVTTARTYDIDPDKVWQSLHQQVEKDVQKHTRFVKEREFVEFNQLAIHRASPAKNNGWRLFFRLSFTHRKPANEIRNQTQVYVDVNNAGW